MTLWCEPVTSLTQHLVTRFDVMMHLQPLSFKKQLISAYPNIAWNRRQRVLTGDSGFLKSRRMCSPPKERKSVTRRAAARRVTLFLSFFCRRRRRVLAEPYDF